MTKLSVIITSFNTRDLLKNLLGSLKNSIKTCQENDFKVEIIVVDNNSSDGTQNFLKKNYPWINLILNKKNVGFSAANNIGIRASKGELILLLNSDTKVFPETLFSMINFMDKMKQAGAATCLVQLPEGPLDPASHRGFPTPWNSFCYFSGLEKLFPKSRIFSGYHQGWKNLNQSHEIDACAGAFFLVRKLIIDKVGTLDERFFMYGEDIDWAYRIKKAGYRIFYYPGTKIIHYKKRSGRKKMFVNSINKDLTIEIRNKTKQDFFQTMKIFYQKHYLKKYPRFLQKITFLGIDLISKIID